MVSDVGSASIKPFRLVKFFSFTSLLVILLTTLMLAWIISNYAQKALLDRSEAYALVFAENLNHQVFQQFVIPTVLRYGTIALRNEQQFKRLDTIVRNVTHGMNIESVSIYDSKENIISYSTTSERVGKQDQGGRGYELARKGQNNSQLETEGSLMSLLPGSEPISCRLITYIPFRQERSLSEETDVIMGVIELEQDLSADYETIIRLQGIIIVTSGLIMAALFAVLRFIVARADRIIEERAAERRRLEEKLHRSERLANLGKMVASVSHEIKNPLGIVRSTAEILGKRLKNEAPANERFANIIIEETSRLDQVVREFLDFARPQTPRLTAVSVNEPLEKAIGFMMSEFEKSGVAVVSRLDGSLPKLPLDSEMLYRAYLNILVNAVQAMPEGGTLTVVSRRRAGGRSIEVEIGDTGRGIAPDKLPHVFTPFYTDKNRGTGLGLAIVKNIVDSLQGSISVESEEGKGTTFRLAFPSA